MARAYTPKDAYALMNLMIKEMTGQQTLTVVDASSFVSAGETVMGYGTENVLNTLSILIGRTLVAVRPYQAKLNIVNSISTDLYTNRLRKISYYARENEASGFFNTDLHSDNLGQGKSNTDGVGSMWKQNFCPVLEMNYGGSSVWDTSTTVTEGQLKAAFRGPDEFNQFIAGIMTEKANDIESTREAFSRLAVLNRIAGTYDFSANMPGSVVNLTTAYNEKFHTNYTSDQLRTTYLDSFLKFFVAEFKLASDFMTHRTNQYHWSPAKTVGDVEYTLLRHTPKNRQKALLYSPLFTEARSNVLPDIFNPQYLSVENYEGVEYWQSFTNKAGIKFTPAIPNPADGTQTTGEEVDLDYVVGIIFDEDAMMTDFQLETSYTTPIEARHGYRNIWWHYARNVINDFTENSIIFIMKDEEE